MIGRSRAERKAAAHLRAELSLKHAYERIDYDFDVSNNPLMIGTTWFFQGCSMAPRQFSDSWMRFTVLP